MIGPPGSGKSMLAHRLPGLLPPMTETEALETATVASISTQGFRLQDWARRPFRAPHHTASGIALVGGGSHPRPGEISLAHNGVLFLDELPEFPRHVLEVLREPLESGAITISRAARQADFPARFQFVAAMNPCPCGYLGDADGRCHCAPTQVELYRARISGPLLDRIDLHVEVSRLDSARFVVASAAESSASIAARVARARAIQMERGNKPNACLADGDIERVCRPERAAKAMLVRALDQLGLSARAYHRILKVARTIADLAERDSIAASHVGEAIQLKRFQVQRAA
jgi:magnesium chelatase family protein